MFKSAIKMPHPDFTSPLSTVHTLAFLLASSYVSTTRSSVLYSVELAGRPDSRGVWHARQRQHLEGAAGDKAHV